jgi:hypothetical protein
MVMAGAAGRGSGVGERRKKRALEAFRNELADLDAEEIQARLDGNRIRSAERRAMARERLRTLRAKEATAAPGPHEDADKPVNSAGLVSDDQQGDDQQGDERPPAEAARSREKDTGNGADNGVDNGVDRAADAGVDEVVTEEDAAASLPLARRIGRLVGMTAAVGGVVLAGAWLIRR